MHFYRVCISRLVRYFAANVLISPLCNLRAYKSNEIRMRISHTFISKPHISNTEHHTYTLTVHYSKYVYHPPSPLFEFKFQRWIDLKPPQDSRRKESKHSKCLSKSSLLVQIRAQTIVHPTKQSSLPSW